MARRKARREKTYLASFLAASFCLGLLLGAVLVFTWTEGLPVLRLKEGEIYKRSLAIVGVEKETGLGRLAILKVELVAGEGRLLINVPPYEDESTQKSFFDAIRAAEHETRRSLGEIDVIASLENLSEETTITGPSASAAMALAIVAIIRFKENLEPNEIRQDAVVSAYISTTGELNPVGEIEAKYQAVREAGVFSLFVVASDQSGYLPDYPGIHVERVSNLYELANLILTGAGGMISSACVNIRPAMAVT